MKPADNGLRKYKCPMKEQKVDIPYPACNGEFSFGELVSHLREMHSESLLIAWLVAATWEDVSSSMDEKCE